MSVWPGVVPNDASPALSGREGELYSVAVDVAARDLEDLLEALALLDFPVNPQIYHEAAVVYVAADGTERAKPVTLVEFPAYGSRLARIQDVLAACGFGSGRVHVSSMLEEMHADCYLEAASPESGYRFRVVRKYPQLAPAGAH